MARSRARMAGDREQMYDAAVREALAAGDDWAALRKAADYLLSEARKRRDRTPGDGALIVADLSGLLRCLAAGLHDLRPARPRGWTGAPRPADLLTVYEDSLARAQAGEA